MKDKPFVSIIIPAYNVGLYIEKCIKSCIDQTFRNIEIIVVDDSSKDNTFEIIEEISKTDSRIKIFKQKNSGVSVARNLGIENANGQWVMFLDGDDWLENDAVEIFFEYVNKLNGTCDIVVSDFYCGDETSKYLSSFLNNQYKYFNKENNIELVKNCILKTKIANQECKTNIGVPWGKIYSLEFIKNNNLRFKPGLKRMQDMVFNLYAFNAAQDVYFVDKPTYNYRYVANSATHKYSPDFEEISNNVMESLEEFMDFSGTRKELEDAFSIKCLNLYKECIKLAYCNSDQDYKLLELNKQLLKLRKNNEYFSTLPIKKVNKELKNYKLVIYNFLIKVNCDFIFYLIQKK